MMRMKKMQYMIHSTAYYIAWFAGIKLATFGYGWLSTLVVLFCVWLQILWESRISKSLDGLWLLIAVFLLISSLIDSILVYESVLIYSANPFSPYFTSPWMMSLWVSFSVILYTTLSGLFNHAWVLGLLSYLGFAFAFYIGKQMAAVVFPYGNITIVFIAGIWSIVIPFGIFLYQKMLGLQKPMVEK